MDDIHKTAEFIRNLPLVQSFIPDGNHFFAHYMTLPIRHLVDIRKLHSLSAEDIVEVVYHNESQVRMLEIARPVYFGRKL